MASLIYAAIASLDGFIEDRNGRFDWAMPDDEVHAFINDAERPVGTYLYGRRMYETMRGWETDSSLAGQSPLMRDFAGIWQAADKIVFSRTLEAVSTSKTRLERAFDATLVRQLKATAARDLSIAGPHLAASAFAAGLVDELQLYLVPVMVGGGKPALPDTGSLELELLDVHHFESGVVRLRHGVRSRES